MRVGAACFRHCIQSRGRHSSSVRARNFRQLLCSMRQGATEGCAGKTYLVTGSTDGIGRHTAEKLLLAGGDVIIHGRNPARVQKTVEHLTPAAKGGNLTSYTYDLASFSQIRQFADAIRADHRSIHVLINNAGVYQTKMSLSEDKFEMTWAVNVLAPFLLTALLKDVITERIVNVSSISAGSRIDFDNLQQEKGFSAHNSYSLSKLAAMMFTYDLAAVMKPRNVTVNCLDPGTVNTKMLIAGWGACGMNVQDANYEFQLATDPGLATKTGQYFVGGRVSQSPSESYDQTVRSKLWRIMQEQTGVSY